MTFNSDMEIFTKWLNRNMDRFKFTPWLDVSAKDFFVVKFHGLAPELKYRVDKSGRAEIIVVDQDGAFWDIICDFDVCPQVSSKGLYFCSLCSPVEYFRSRAALLENHICENMLTWINNLDADALICLYGEPEGECWGADLLNPKKRQINTEFYHTCLPLVS